jgi:hypothetical protein
MPSPAFIENNNATKTMIIRQMQVNRYDRRRYRGGAAVALALARQYLRELE